MHTTASASAKELLRDKCIDTWGGKGRQLHAESFIFVIYFTITFGPAQWMFPQVCFAQILPPTIPFPQKSRTNTQVFIWHIKDHQCPSNQQQWQRHSGVLEAPCNNALLRGPCWEASRPLHQPATQPEQPQACLPGPPKRGDSFCFCFITLSIYWGQGGTCHGAHRCRSQRITWPMDHASLSHRAWCLFPLSHLANSQNSVISKSLLELTPF